MAFCTRRGALLLGALTLVAWNVTLPYVAFTPGPVKEIQELVNVDGASTYPIDGNLFMLTVALEDLNGFELLMSMFDDTEDVVPTEAVRPTGQSEEEYNRQGLELMDQSKRTAIAVALNHLGYEVTLTGDGARVASVLEGSPAEESLQQGDVIVGVDSTTVRWAPDLVNDLANREIGDTVTLKVLRGGETIEVPITLVENTQSPGRPMIGIQALTENERMGELPFGVDIDDANIGGPSAGLMYTLTIIDLLTEDDLVKGHLIAGTGTIDSEGNVGGIGGVRQKVVGAEAFGAEYILVPQSNYEDALTAPTPDEKIVPVATLQDALDFFATLQPPT